MPEGARVKAGTTLARQVDSEKAIDSFTESTLVNIKNAKKDIILAHRILSKINYGNDIMNDHLSVSIPSRKTPGNRTMITSTFGTDWSTISFDDLMQIEVETRRYPNSSQNNRESGLSSIDGSKQPDTQVVGESENKENKNRNQRNKKGRKEIDLITSELHRSLLSADPNIHSIFHLHTPSMLEFACLKGEDSKLLMLHPSSCQFYNKLMYFDKSTDLKGTTGTHIYT